MAATSSIRFPCTPGGAVARGRRRMRALLWGLSAALLGVAAAAWMTARPGAALLAVAVAVGPWLAWRMNSNVDVEALILAAGKLTVLMRWRRESFDLDAGEGAVAATARRLTAEERRHLESLATTAGITAGVGGFDSHLLGELNLYASDLERAVLVEAGEARLVVTPDDVEGFLEAARFPATMPGS